MKPETTDFLTKAEAFLRKTEAMLAGGFPEKAGRAAYLVGFHAAQALIFERSGRLSKTHSGVRSEFARLTRDDPSFDLKLRPFLARSYPLNGIADYEVGPDATVSPRAALDAIGMARQYLKSVTDLLR